MITIKSGLPGDRIQFAMISTDLETGEDLTPPSSSCTFYNRCQSSMRDPVGCQRDLHGVKQFFCDGPAQQYIDNTQRYKEDEN
ncbi:hypothetical protein HY212_07680 [Candidatus Pacearchaeota archaeon]|nr:hypothetical protein [Candidatus Pacearchaeota archaeon]